MLARIWNVVLVVLIAVAAVLAIAFAGVRLVRLTPFVVLSGSMEPVYPVGSIVYVQEADPESVQVGDNITFSLDSGTLVTHQVWQIDADAQLFYTQGIANVDAQGNITHDGAPVPWANLMGMPVACIPYLGYLNVAVTQPPGIYLVVVAVALIVAVSILFELFAKPKSKAPPR